jgi:ATP-dependent Lhr-like helicase
VLAQHVMGCACAAPFDEAALLAEVRSCLPYAWIDAAVLERVLQFVATGGYSLKAYDKFQRIVRDRDGVWRLTHPDRAAKHRLNAGIIIDSEMLTVRFRNGRQLGRVEERFAASLSPKDTFSFAGMSLEVEQVKDMEVSSALHEGGDDPLVRRHAHGADDASGRPGAGAAGRPGGLGAVPDDVREWLEVQDWRSEMPAPGTLLVESFRKGGGTTPYSTPLSGGTRTSRSAC